jgi:hypothetical protein
MSNTATINGTTYDDLTAAINPTTGAINDGIYWGVGKLCPVPSGSLQTVQYSKVAFPGTFDGVGTVELCYEPGPLKGCFVLVGSLATVATQQATLNAALIRSDGARYTVSFPGQPSTPGCKVAGIPMELPELEQNLGGKVMKVFAVTWERLSTAN